LVTYLSTVDAPKPSKAGLKDHDVSAHDELRLSSVTFAYPSRPHVKILDDLNVSFEPGKITAIVGASGSGKSTIVGLLERWYELSDGNRVMLPASRMEKNDKKDRTPQYPPKSPQENHKVSEPQIPLSGSIFIGDKNIDSVNLKWWRSQIGLVQQEPFIFNDTIYKNVEYGLVGSQWENERAEIKKSLVEEACRKAFADEFIAKLPQRYQTHVGDAGIKLSGGQRQRLAIARSIVKQPKVLILDEATSSIDARGERLVQAALDKVSEGRTTITIAHRLSTIKKADKIVVLQKGKVVEEGTHEGLLSNPDGVYLALVNAQKLSMEEPFPEEEADRIQSSNPLTQAQNEVIEAAYDMKVEESYKPKSFFGSFGLLMYEQRTQWQW
jgi:ATP-binding cassette subfamily B (MDR/TAP) protein 1